MWLLSTGADMDVIHSHKRPLKDGIDWHWQQWMPEGVLTYEQYVENCSEEEPEQPKRHIYDENTRLYTSAQISRAIHCARTSI